MIDFKNIEYLKTGNYRQRKTYHFLIESRILEVLKEYNPILTGTIPIGIDLPDSDLDIICECYDYEIFCKNLKFYFGKNEDFKLWTNVFYGIKANIASFKLDNFNVEIFGQNIPTYQQQSYKHMIIENKILLEKGLDFKNKVIQLKISGLKTEPAFAKLLGLKGDPYIELLKFKSNIV
jgi:hypothetical protein